MNVVFTHTLRLYIYYSNSSGGETRLIDSDVGGGVF